MELVFLYVNLSKSKFIEKSGFNFSPNYNFKVNYKDGWYELSENKQKKTIADDFFDKDRCISNVTAIVGENGAGKTTLLEYILLSGLSKKKEKNKEYYDYKMDQFEYKKQIVIYKDGDKLVCYHNVNDFKEFKDPRIKYINVNKDKKFSDNLKNNTGFKNMTKIYLTNSLYSKNEISTHGRLDTITLNPNTINWLKNSFFEKSVCFDKSKYDAFNKIPTILSEYKDTKDFQNILDLLYTKYILSKNEKSIFENLVNRDLMVSFKNVNKYLRKWDVEYLNHYKKDESGLISFRDTWVKSIVKVEEELHNVDIALNLYENLLFELITYKGIKNIGVFGSKQEMIEYIESGVKSIKDTLYFKNAYNEIKAYKKCLNNCMQYPCLLPRDDSGYVFNKIIKPKSRELSEFLDLVEDAFLNSESSFVLKYIDIGGLDFSSGERALLNFFSWMHMLPYFNKIQTEIEESTFDNILLLIDEIDLYCHPSWQQKLLDYLIQEVRINFVGKNVQIIFTTHSPIVLSDMPKSNIIYLKNENGKFVIDEKENHKETFGANIYKLFDDAFFLERQGQIGQFAKRKIEALIGEVLNDEKLDVERINRLKQEISMIGEPLIREKLISKLTRYEFNDEMSLKEKKLKLYRERIKQLEGE
mgnify:FL=1